MEFGASLAQFLGPRKSRAAENLFVMDLALLRVSPVPFVGQAEARNLVT